MNIKELKDRALFALSVPKCVCCGEKLDYGQKAFCRKCSDEFDNFRMRNCSICSKVLSSCTCSNSNLENHFVKRIIKCYRYLHLDDKHPSTSLIYSLKKDNRRDVFDKCSDLLVEALSNSIDDLGNCVITNIPRRHSAIVEHGIDHSAILAKKTAIKIGADYISVLKSNAKKEQKSLDRDQRRKNADFSITKESDLHGKTVLIIDDIITSGASMSNAAILLRSMGARETIAVCLAIAYKDS